MAKKKKPAKPKAKLKKSRQKLAPAKVKKETFTLGYRRPSEFKQQRIAPPEEKIDLPAQPKPRQSERKSQIPNAATALIGAAAATGAVSFVLLILLKISAVFALGISAGVFVGSAIIFHDKLEKRSLFPAL